MSQKIKSVKGIHINYSMEDPSKPAETEWIETSSYISSQNEFDIQGNIVKSSTFNHEQEIHEYYEYIYDTHNNLIEELCYFDEDELAEHKFIYWDENNLCTSEKVIYQEDGSENTSYFTYNEKNLLTEKKVLDQDDELEEIDTYEYENDKLICEKKVDCDKKFVYTKKYKYDENNSISEYEYSTPDPYEYVKYEYFYNEKGEREKSLRYNHKNQLIEKNLMEFDEKGNLIELSEENQRSNKITRFSYDDNNNQIRQEEFNQEEVLTTSIERTYNTDNKLIESVVYTQDPTDGIQQMYAYKYDYEFWQE
jgi:hypothetical protein